jgi:hypothetical protein
MELTARLSAACALAAFVLAPAASAATPSAWEVMATPDGSSCAAVGEGKVLFATPDGVHYGLFVPGVTVGDRAERSIKIDGADLALRWVQVRTSAFSMLDAATVTKITGAESLEIAWPDHAAPLSADGLKAAYPKLKSCGEGLASRRLSIAQPSGAPTRPTPEAPTNGPLVLTLECQGSATWTASGSVSSGIPGDVTHDRDVSYRDGGQGRIRVHFGPDGNTVKFPATFPAQVSYRPATLSSVNVGPDQIVAETRGIFGKNKAVTIDRHSGEIDLELGGVSFSGTCRKSDDAGEPRKF